jgi:hypothetical protein
MPKRMTIWATALLIVVLATPLPTLAQTKSPCEGIIPKGLAQYLNDKFPTFRPKLLSDLDRDERRLWSETHPRACPGFAAGHFQSSSKLSHALLLVPQSHPTGGYKLIVITAAAEDGFHSEILESNDTGSNSGMVIARVSPGKQSAFEGSKTIHLGLDSISVQWLEKAAVLYYWSKGKFRTLNTSD